MATTKHLDPTNVDISIPAMTDQPNASVFSNCVDKEADAINALNSNLTNFLGWNSKSLEITDTTFGFIDTGISSASYFLLCAFTPFSANKFVRISNLDSSGSNYRIQITNATDGTVVKTGTYSIAFCVVDRSKVALISL